MKFERYDVATQVKLAKQEFTNLVKTIFDNPEHLKGLINEKKLSTAQAKAVIKCVNKFNAMDCGCCRRFEPAKLNANPLEKDLEPVLDLVQESLKNKEF